MPSPVKPSDFCSLTPTPAISACESIKRVFFSMPALICDLLTYMFDADGNPTEEFLGDIQTVPPGCMMDYGGLTAPAGWLPCDGREVSRTEYAALFAAIGTLWGDGDGSTTFNVPDLTKRTSIGPDVGYSVGNTGGESALNVPNHTHVLGCFTGAGNDDVYLKVQAIESPETFTGRAVTGDIDANQQATINEGDSLGGANDNNAGLVTTIPVEQSSVADGNMMPYAVTLKIIKA